MGERKKAGCRASYGQPALALIILQASASVLGRLRRKATGREQTAVKNRPQQPTAPLVEEGSLVEPTPDPNHPYWSLIAGHPWPGRALLALKSGLSSRRVARTAQEMVCEGQRLYSLSERRFISIPAQPTRRGHTQQFCVSLFSFCSPRGER